MVREPTDPTWGKDSPSCQACRQWSWRPGQFSCPFLLQVPRPSRCCPGLWHKPSFRAALHPLVNQSRTKKWARTVGSCQERTSGRGQWTWMAKQPPVTSGGGSVLLSCPDSLLKAPGSFPITLGHFWCLQQAQYSYLSVRSNFICVQLLSQL